MRDRGRESILHIWDTSPCRKTTTALTSSCGQPQRVNTILVLVCSGQLARFRMRILFENPQLDETRLTGLPGSHWCVESHRGSRSSGSKRQAGPRPPIRPISRAHSLSVGSS